MELIQVEALHAEPPGSSHSRRIDAGRGRCGSRRVAPRVSALGEDQDLVPDAAQAIARATTSSECPSPYEAAESTQFTPPSNARRIAAIAASSSARGPPPHGPCRPPATLRCRSG